MCGPSNLIPISHFPSSILNTWIDEEGCVVTAEYVYERVQETFGLIYAAYLKRHWRLTS